MTTDEILNALQALADKCKGDLDYALTQMPAKRWKRTRRQRDREQMLDGIYVGTLRALHLVTDMQAGKPNSYVDYVHLYIRDNLRADK